jgi:hypothetical protein
VRFKSIILSVEMMHLLTAWRTTSHRVLLQLAYIIIALSPGLLSGGELILKSPTMPAAGAKGHVVLANGDLLATRSGRIGGGKDAGGRNAVFCSKSLDQGTTWQEIGVIVSDDPDTDLGDGHLCQLRSGEILYSFRRNRHSGRYKGSQTTRLEASLSSDGGLIWSPHSVIARADFRELAKRPGIAVNQARMDGVALGFWSSFLFQDPSGKLHCFFDDEITPLLQGFPRHQWITRKTWDPLSRDWLNPVVVSRTDSPGKLARDGMPSVVRMKDGGWVCVFESCALESPHPNVIRMVESSDEGATWNWPKGRRILYQPPNGQSAICPWLVAAGQKRLVCVFATNEDWPQREKPGLPPHKYHMEIKYMLGTWDAATWTPPRLLHRGGQRNYKPGAVWLQSTGQLHFQWLEYGKGFLGMRAGFP